MRIGKSEKELESKMLFYKPDLIGISMITLEYKNTYNLISKMKGILPQTKIAVGGHHTTILKEKVLEECPDIDFGVVADGEHAIIELCRSDVDYPEIKGLIYRENGNVLFNGERPPIENLSEYTFPKYIKFNLKDYSKQIPVHSSRGCVFQCTFCPNKLLGRKFREKSINDFVNEIEYWYDRGYYQFAIDDDNFTLNKDRVYSICDEIEKRNMKKLFIRCSNGIRADRVDEHLLQRMKEIGVREIGFGVDGGNNKVLKNLKKGENFETIERAVKAACDVGLDVKAFIIVGTPGETKDDIEDSISFAFKYPIARVNFNNAIPYPGTEMYDYVKKNGLFLIPPEEYLNNVAEEKAVPVFETPELPKEERLKILSRCHEVEKQVMKNTAIRMYGHIPFAKFFIVHFFNIELFENLFFKNLFLRKAFEWLRYKKLMRR
jgi:radical SAM superfamily enzyme YgiQ (UPF0313 family)